VKDLEVSETFKEVASNATFRLTGFKNKRTSSTNPNHEGHNLSEETIAILQAGGYISVNKARRKLRQMIVDLTGSENYDEDEEKDGDDVDDKDDKTSNKLNARSKKVLAQLENYPEILRKRLERECSGEQGYQGCPMGSGETPCPICGARDTDEKGYWD
jgi:hypothetical protein